MTDTASAYVKVGEMLMAKRRKLFWSPCIAHYLDLFLIDIGVFGLPIPRDIIAKVRKITI